MQADGFPILPWNWLGHAAGVAIFGMFLWLLWRDRSGVTLAGRNKAILAACFALLWNALSLATSLFGENAWLTSLGAAFLSLLPAVLFDLAIHHSPPWAARAGYCLAAAAALLHMLELANPAPDVHTIGLYLIAAGFGVLALYAGRRSRKWQPALAVLLLALTFLHFDSTQQHYASLLEILTHHAGIPLAMFVLLQNFRYVLLDALVRPFTNLVLAFVFGMAGILWTSWVQTGVGLPRGWPLLLMGMTGLLLLFAAGSKWVQTALTQLIFRRSTPESLLAKVRELSGTTEEILQDAGAILANYFTAQLVAGEVSEALQELSGQNGLRPILTAASPALSSLRQQHSVEAVLPVFRAPGQTDFLMFSRRAEGRRYLSEDLAVMARAGDELRERLARSRESEMEKLVALAELRSLQAQIHPHFLFNALNTLYALIPAEAPGARRMLLNLSDVFRYLLRGEKSLVPLSEELRIVEAYLEIESLRLGDRLESKITIEPGLEDAMIPLLSVEPLVENAVKHGVAAQAGRGSVHVSASRDESGMRVAVCDSGHGFRAPSESKDHAGVGLSNVNRRLALCYGAGHNLEIESNSEGTRVSFRVPLPTSEISVADSAGERA